MVKKRVMIIDDAKVMRILIKNLLESDPTLEIIASCENGQEALGLLRRDPDIIVTDLEMPVMDGLTFLEQARGKTKAPIVVLSSIAVAGSKEAVRAKALGARAVLQKPSGSVSIDLREKMGAEIIRTVKHLTSPGATV